MKSDWKEFRLGDLGDIVTGRTPPSSRPECFGDEYAFITPSDMDGRKIASTTERYLSEAGATLLRRNLLPPGSVAVSCIGWQMGKVIMTSRPSFSNQQLNAIIPRQGVAPDFLYYSLVPWREHLLSLGSAAGVRTPILNKSAFSELRLLMPPLRIQRRIAVILSAYDDLIENNTRRIAILEEMAKALYREWFVHFRFPAPAQATAGRPGHEKVEMVESPLGPIPAGWEVAALGEQLVALESGKRPKGGVRQTADGIPSIGAENINGIGRHDFASEKFVPREFFEQMRKGVVRDRDVGIYKDGAYIGKSSYFRDGFPHSECCVNEHVFLLRADGVRLTQNALYLWLQEPDTLHAIRATNANAAQPGINQQSVGGLELVVPDSKTAARFDYLVEPLLAETINLAKRNQHLRTTRDLLLPKLISGEIDVSALEIDTERLAQ